MKALYGIDSMPETAENVAAEYEVARTDQDAFALRSQQRYAAANAKGSLRRRNRTGHHRGKKGEVVVIDRMSIRAKPHSMQSRS